MSNPAFSADQPFKIHNSQPQPLLVQPSARPHPAKHLIPDHQWHHTPWANLHSCPPGPQEAGVGSSGERGMGALVCVGGHSGPKRNAFGHQTLTNDQMK